MTLTDEERKVLRKKLYSKMGERKIQRSTKKSKEKILEEGLKDMGIDKKKLMDDINRLQEMGGKLELDFKQ